MSKLNLFFVHWSDVKSIEFGFIFFIHGMKFLLISSSFHSSSLFVKFLCGTYASFHGLLPLETANRFVAT